MSIEKLIASLPNKTPAERAAMRARAEARLCVDPNAASFLEALADLEARERANADAHYQEALAQTTGKPLADRVRLAFEHFPVTDAERPVIQVLLDYPSSTCAELSGKLGWAPNTWDMHFGSICAARADFLRDLRGTPAEGRSANLPLLTMQERGDDNVIRYTRKLEAVEGVQLLGFRVKSH